MHWSDSPEEWQKYVVSLLTRHHGPTEFQEVPDRDRGDYGIEGFSRNGCAYQCYCAEEPLSTAELYEKQAAKITQDLKKFRDNSEKLMAILGPTVVRRWNLVVPRFESARLIAHAEKHAKLVRAASPPYVSTDFSAMVMTAESFKVEAQLLAGVGLVEIRLEPDDNVEGEIDSDLLVNLDRKIKKLTHLSSTAQNDLKKRLIQDYLDGQNLLEKYHTNYPELYSKALRAKSDWERFLSQRCLTAAATNSQALLASQITSYSDALEKALPGVGSYNVDFLTQEAIADWLLRCPLDFPTNV